jgi:malonate-semialdehyde dehydrogenase (acetylating)/methylmalonate-semialdehyde dehydrogenase
MAILDEPIKGTLLLRNFIGGEWVESKGALADVVNPATGQVVAKAPSSTPEELDAAVGAATDAFPDWRRTPPTNRAQCLYRLRELMTEHFEELSRIQTQEHGKTIDESRGETRRGIEEVEVACGIPTLMMGYNAEDIAVGIDEYLIRQPIGVFGVLPPYNFPFMIPLFFAPYAVAAGNCVVLKPSDECPATMTRVAELVEEAGFPPGVWNVVHGGKDVGNAMLEHPDIAGIGFVGSTAVARHVYERCGATAKRVIANGGASNFIVVMPDCSLDRTIRAVMTSFFGNAGQRCLAGQSLIVVGDDEGFYDRLLDGVVKAAREIKIGYGLDDSVQMGPMRDSKKKQRVMGFIESGVQEGAVVRLDGREGFEIAGGYPDTCFLGPTVMENVTPNMRIVREEIFGPTLNMVRAENLEDAIRICNENPFGNADCIFTSSGKTARQFQYEVISGNVGINIGIAAPIAFFPLSGRKNSFFGVLHTQGQETIRFFTEDKVVVQRWI